MIAIWKREWKSYFHNVIGWLFVAAILAVFGIYFFAYNLTQGSPYIYLPLQAIAVILLIAVPVLTMRSFSEERKAKTDQMILTAPISVGKVVCGKYLAMAAVYTIDIAIIAVCPLILSRFGTVPMGESYAAIIGFWLMGCTFIAVGMFISSLTESQVIAAVLSFVVLFLSFMMSGITSLISTDGNWLTKILSALNLTAPFSSFLNGCLDITGIVYYLTVILLFCFLTTQSIQKRRWSVSRKTFSLGVFSTSFIVVAVAITVVVNIVVSSLPTNLTAIDWTYNKLYEISEQTETVLKSLEDDVTIYVLVAEKSKDTTIDETLGRYVSLSKHITVKYVNPSVSPNFYTEYTDTAPAENSLIIVSGERSRVVDYYDIYDYQTDYTTYSYTLAGYDAEGQITSGIEYVTMASDDLPVVYQLTGHNETELGSAFVEVLEKANITLESLELLNEESVPEDAKALIINSPQSDFNQEDAQKVIDYLQAGGKAIIVGSCEHQDLKNFNSILEAYEVSFVDGIVAENDPNYYYYAYGSYYLFPKVDSTAYTSGVSDTYVFMPLAQGISYPDTEDEDSSITYTPLLETTGDAVSKTNASNATTYEYEEGDVKGPFTLALAVEAAVDDENTTKLAVIGSPLLFDDETNLAISGNNATMFTNVISQMVEQTELNSSVIPEKEVSLSNLTISAFTVTFLGVLITIFAPVALLVIGIVIWILRRKK